MLRLFGNSSDHRILQDSAKYDRFRQNQLVYKNLQNKTYCYIVYTFVTQFVIQGPNETAQESVNNVKSGSIVSLWATVLVFPVRMISEHLLLQIMLEQT